MEEQGTEPEQESGGKMRLWFKRMGIGAFLFFLIKGLVWLAIFLGLGSMLGLEGC